MMLLPGGPGGPRRSAVISSNFSAGEEGWFEWGEGRERGNRKRKRVRGRIEKHKKNRPKKINNKIEKKILKIEKIEKNKKEYKKMKEKFLMRKKTVRARTSENFSAEFLHFVAGNTATLGGGDCNWDTPSRLKLH